MGIHQEAGVLTATVLPGVSSAAPAPFPPAPARTARVLCVDMDGSLIATDTLWESLLALLKHQPWSIVLCLIWMLRGKAYFKHQVAKRVTLDPRALPYREEVVNFLQREFAAGREIVLATAADGALAKRVAAHVGVFTSVLSSDGRTNLAGREKLAAISAYAGPKGFDYIGNSAADLPVWRAGSVSIVVHPSRRLLRRVRTMDTVYEVPRPRINRWAQLLRMLRLHQWAKNVLLFVPLFTGHRITEPRLVLLAIAAFVSLGLCASGGYVINDLLDLEADRRHPRKRNRPFASGALPVSLGIRVAPLLLIGGLALGTFLVSPLFVGVLGLYVVTSAAYSWHLKRVLVVDVLVLAGLYTLRVFAGGVATTIGISQWLLAFSVFFFLSLAFVKRYIEVANLSGRSNVPGRAYLASDRELLRNLGVTSGYLAVLVLALYVSSHEVMALYRHPQVLWLTCPLLLYWITRAWFLADRDQLHDDPVVFALRDRASYGIVAAVGLVALAAI